MNFELLYLELQPLEEQKNTFEDGILACGKL